MSSSQKLQFVKLTKDAHTPIRGSPKAAGLDLYSARDATVSARGKALVFTDLQVQLPDGCYGRIAPRSGLALKHHIDICGGVIDQDYRGNVGVIIYNHSNTPFTVSRGDRIAQLICEKIYYPEVEEVMSLNTTERGADGFGSTGISKDFEFLQMSLVQDFKNVGASMITPLHTLEQNKPYPIVSARKTNTQYGLSVQLTLETEKELFVRVYLPKRYAQVFEDDDVTNINYKKNYNLLYKGKAGSAYILQLVEYE